MTPDQETALLNYADAVMALVDALPDTACTPEISAHIREVYTSLKALRLSIEAPHLSLVKS